MAYISIINWASDWASMAFNEDSTYVDILINPMREISEYKPKFGTGSGVNLAEFQKLYGNDPLYHWIGFDSHLMYAAHRASGAMTSLYRNLGTGCEHLFKSLLKDGLGLSSENIKWEYVATSEQVASLAGTDMKLVDSEDISDIAGLSEDVKQKEKKNSLDGRIDLTEITSIESRKIVEKWLGSLKNQLGITWTPIGSVFEVRQGYKSMDSKRQSADIANATQALSRQRIPVLVVFSNQIDDQLVKRYEASGWGLLRGDLAKETKKDPTRNTFAFIDQIIGFDLEAFFLRNAELIRSEIFAILETLLGSD